MPRLLGAVILHITASGSDHESAEHSLAVGADGLVPHSVAPGQLIHAARELLQLRSLQHKLNPGPNIPPLNFS